MGTHATPALVHSMSAGGKSDEYRSVIDDLTIENRKLKRRLKKYEVSRRPHLEKERLFEVKFHGLPSKKRRELEEQLSAFAASIEASEDRNKENQTQDNRHASSSLTNSASNSRPADSGYNSMSNVCMDMSNFGPPPTSSSDRNSPPNVEVKVKRVETFLDDIPEGLMPKSMALSEWQKKKLVVKRLEQLFAGGVATGEHCQPVQQQEVSSMAAKADRATRTKQPFVEGVREAHMSKYPINSGALENEDQNSSDQEPKAVFSGSESPDQRPTRPLDLDPDRAQIPSENVEYIRHLGLATPRFTAEESDEDGWIYLNLLMSMAQLHIINVTADFVRSAVADVSEKFELSSDGQKIRWKGGVGRTRMSSDSGNSSAKNQSPQDSDSLEETAQKTRKLEKGKFAAVPIGVRDLPLSDTRVSAPHPFHYKPLFNHRESSSGEDTPNLDTDSYSSKHSYTFGNTNCESSKGGKSASSKERRRGQHSGIIFYNGQFCIDLYGDSRRRPSLTVESHDETRDILGCPRRRIAPSRTSSGSSLPFIPFKTSARGSNQGTAPTTTQPSGDHLEMDLSADWPSGTANADVPLLSLNISGIGGTHPSDHFALRVKTRRTVLGKRDRAKYLTCRRISRRRLVHNLHDSLLDNFRTAQGKSFPESSNSLMAALNTVRPPSPSDHLHTEPPIKTEIIDTQFTRLKPSPLPAPSNFYGMASSSDDSAGSEGSSSSAASHRWRLRPQIRPSPSTDEADQDEEMDEEEEEEDETTSESSSIDMLAPARLAHPGLVAASERAFEREMAVR